MNFLVSHIVKAVNVAAAKWGKQYFANIVLLRQKTKKPVCMNKNTRPHTASWIKQSSKNIFKNISDQQRRQPYFGGRGVEVVVDLGYLAVSVQLRLSSSLSDFHLTKPALL